MSRSGGYKCYNIRCGSCIGKTLCGEPADAALGCEDRIVSKETNADRIRAMIDEELAIALVKYEGTEKRRTPYGGHEHIFYGPNGEKCGSKAEAVGMWFMWLSKPAEED